MVGSQVYPPTPKRKFTWRERFALFFIRPKISVDAATGYWLVYKVWRGRIYVLKDGQQGS